MDRSNDPQFENDERIEENMARYQERRSFREKEEGKRRWWIPLTILLIIVAAIGALWYFASRSEFWFFQDLMAVISPEEEEIQIIMPEALFAGQDVDEVAARAIEDQGVDEIVPIEDDMLVYNMSPAVKESLHEEARTTLEEKLSDLDEYRQYPYLVDISYDDSFTEFFLLISDGEEMPTEALRAASELFVTAVYYHYLDAAGDDVREVRIELENEETDALETFAYPADLNRVASILERPERVDEEPAGPEAGDRVVVDTGPDNLNLREGPEITYLIIGVLSSGTVLEVTGTEGEWLEVVTPEQKEGWVHGDFVKLVEDDT